MEWEKLTKDNVPREPVLAYSATDSRKYIFGKIEREWVPGVRFYCTPFIGNIRDYGRMMGNVTHFMRIHSPEVYDA